MMRRNFMKNILLFIFAFLFGYTVKKEDENILLKERDSGSANGGGLGPLTKELKKKVNKNEIVINVKDFGAKGDGVTDDTKAIQAAIDAVNGGSSFYGQKGLKGINSIYFPAGDYVVNTTIEIKEILTGGLTLFGYGTVANTRMGARILSNVNGAVFLSTKPQITFKNISFYHRGKTKDKGTIAIQMAKKHDSDDAELTIIGCTIDNYETGIKHEGRSCKVADGSIVACKYAISLSWTKFGDFAAKPNHTDIPFGFRAFHISDMRFHLCEYAIFNDGRFKNDQIRSVLIANNLLDLDTILFYGGLNYAVIEGNMIDLENKTTDVAKIHITSGGRNISIIGNTLSGYVSTGDNKPTRNGKMGIYFGVEAKGCTIVGNTLSGFSKSAINFSKGATGLTLVANSLYDNSTALQLDGTYTSSNISNNTFSANSKNYIGEPIFSPDSRFDGQGLVPVTSDNKWLSLVGPSSELASLSWEDAGSKGLTLNAIGGSINFNPSNGSVRPFTDNKVSLGFGSQRYSELYLGTGTINTSDEREKQYIKPIDKTVLRAWSRVQYSQFKFSDAVQQKKQNARWHFGFIAQRVKEAFESEGLDPFEYGILCYNEWEDEKTGLKKNRYGIRYEEALVLECAYLRSKLEKL